MSVYGEAEKDKTFHKAVKAEPVAPKRKHCAGLTAAAEIIVDSWNYGAINIFKQIQKEPVDKNGLVCFKALTVMHKVLQEGAPRVLRTGFRYCNMLRHLQKTWHDAADQHYAVLNTEYAYFLRGKVTFHHKHPLVMGNLSLDDYTQKVKNQPEVAVQVRQEMVGHLLDLQFMVLRVQAAIFRFHGRDLHESKVAALVPLLVESDSVYRITVHHLLALCDRVADLSVVTPYIERFNQQHGELRVFYDAASRISYVTSIMSVPQLPASPPHFVATGKLVHVVPEGDRTMAVTSLMFEEQARAAPAVAPVAQPPPQPAAVVPQAQPQAQQAAPAGWVQFGDAQVAQASNGQQAQQAQLSSASAGGPNMDQLRLYIGQLEALCRSKDDHIAYWKNMYEQALANMQVLQQQAEANGRRADELENHLQGLHQQLQVDRQNQMLRKLEHAVNSVKAALGQLGDATNTGNPSARPEEIVAANETIAQVLDTLDGAAQRRDHLALTSTLKDLTKINMELCNNSKGVAALTDDKELADALTNATQRTTEAIQQLLNIIRENPNDADAILAASALVRQCNAEVQAATEAIMNRETVKEEGIDISSTATSELLRAAAVIQDAADRLIAAKKAARERAQRKENKVQLEVSEAIFDAAVAITEASKNLVNQASKVQEENVAAGRAPGGKRLYKKDVVWSQGLISASKGVASSVSELVKNANGAADGSLGEEELVAASKGVASATTQLVVAARVRSDPNSEAQKALESASKTIGKTTRLLVAAAKATQEEDAEEDQVDISQLSLTEKKIKEMEEQTRILKLEKELERARQRLAQTRKQAYSQE